MTPDEANMISNECLWVLMEFKREYPKAYESAMERMDISDDQFEEAFDVIFGER